MSIPKIAWLVVLAVGFTSAASPQPPKTTVRTPQLEN